MDHFVSYSKTNHAISLQYTSEHMCMTCTYSNLQHTTVRNSGYRLTTTSTDQEIMHLQSAKLFLKSTLLILTPLNRG
jgi:hypothetical protein